jgi:hypothetical protein
VIGAARFEPTGRLDAVYDEPELCWSCRAELTGVAGFEPAPLRIPATQAPAQGRRGSLVRGASGGCQVAHRDKIADCLELLNRRPDLAVENPRAQFGEFKMRLACRLAEFVIVAICLPRVPSTKVHDEPKVGSAIALARSPSTSWSLRSVVRSNSSRRSIREASRSITHWVVSRRHSSRLTVASVPPEPMTSGTIVLQPIS